MAAELFFLRLIAEAMAQPDRRRALRDAFERILQIGEQGREQVGYEQFLRFMNAVKETSEHPEFADRPLTIELVLERGDVVLGHRRFDADSRRQSWSDIRPGSYCLRTTSGLVLWEGLLTEREVVWTEAFPDRNLPMAAETGAEERHVSRRISLLDSSVELCVCPGPESASIEITIGGSHSVP